MAKPKQRQLVAIPPKKNSTPSGLEVEPLPGEDSWVIVKKQIVKILIPPIPVTKQSTTPDSEPTQPQARPRKTTLTQSKYPIEKPMSLPPNKVFPTARRSPRPIATFGKLPTIGHTIGSENHDQDDNFRHRNALLGVHSNSRISKRALNFLGVGGLVNQRMRASNLDRKLRRAGGLSRWLASLGLDRFVKLFQGKTVNKFLLVNLTMKKLKDMGADAVGPRRKLMHAIDCLCQPYCFEAL